MEVKDALKIMYYIMSSDGKSENLELQPMVHRVVLQFFKSAIGETDNRVIDEVIGMDEEEMFEPFDSEADDAMIECKKQIDKSFDDSDYIEVLKEGISDCLADNDDDDSLTFIVFFALYAAYADGECSEKKKDLLRFVFRKSNIEKAVFLEMEDGVKTLIDCQVKKVQAENSDRPYKEVKAVIDELDRKEIEINQKLSQYLSADF